MKTSILPLTILILTGCNSQNSSDLATYEIIPTVTAQQFADNTIEIAVKLRTNANKDDIYSTRKVELTGGDKLSVEINGSESRLSHKKSAYVTSFNDLQNYTGTALLTLDRPFREGWEDIQVPFPEDFSITSPQNEDEYLYHENMVLDWNNNEWPKQTTGTFAINCSMINGEDFTTESQIYHFGNYDNGLTFRVSDLLLGVDIANTEHCTITANLSRHTSGDLQGAYVLNGSYATTLHRSATINVTVSDMDRANAMNE